MIEMKTFHVICGLPFMLCGALALYMWLGTPPYGKEVAWAVVLILATGPLPMIWERLQR